MAPSKTLIRGRKTAKSKKPARRKTSRTTAPKASKKAAKTISSEPKEAKKRGRKPVSPNKRKVGQSISLPFGMWGILNEKATGADMNLSNYIHRVLEKHLKDENPEHKATESEVIRDIENKIKGLSAAVTKLK